MKKSNHSSSVDSGPAVDSHTYSPLVAIKSPTKDITSPAGSGKKEILDYAFGCELPKHMAKFKPELILISAGFDSRINDPLGQFQLEDEDFFELTKIILNLGDEYANSNVVSVLEGGYNLNGLASSSIAHLQALLNRTF